MLCASWLDAACAQNPASETGGSVQVAFTPHEPADALLVGVIDSARNQILVQAYTFTYRKFASALLAARRRGVEVVVLADRDQTLRQPSVIASLAAGNLPVLLDGQHESAHNKVMIIDADAPDCAVVTGSYNFSFSAQHRNAENLLVLRGIPALCEKYRANWSLHRVHSLPYRR
jgi:phosphatidylserine/phosphatidylglycerophosphate/cardiolipin synthase-like enzyme